MRHITTGDLVRALEHHIPTLTIDMVRRWAKAGRLKTYRNPGSPRGWFFIDEASLSAFLTKCLLFDRRLVQDVFARLGD